MSSISLNGASPALTQLLYGTSNANPALDGSGSISATAHAPGAIQLRNPYESGDQFGVSPDANLFQSIQQSVTSALASVQGDTAADPNQVVQNAIAQAIKQTGTNSTSSTPSSDPDGDGEVTNSTQSTDSSSPTQSFFDTLQSNGINPQQFQNDFLSAVQQAQQGGSVDPSTVFNGFPTGLSVNTAG